MNTKTTGYADNAILDAQPCMIAAKLRVKGLAPISRRGIQRAIRRAQAAGERQVTLRGVTFCW